MDHIPQPLHPIHPVVEVPLLSLEPYDGGNLVTYPGRQGWGVRSIAEWEQLFSQPTRPFCAFLQRWLYFGILESFLGARIDPRIFARRQLDWTSPDASTYSLTSERLPLIIERHIGNVRRDSLKAYGNLYPGLEIQVYLSKPPPLRMDDAMIQPTHAELARHEPLTTFITTHSTRMQDPRDPRIVASISLLIGTLAMSDIKDLHITLGNFPVIHGNFPLDGEIPLHGEIPWFSFTWARLRHDGWCPSQLVALFEQFSASGLWFISNLERPNPTEEHPMIHVRPYVKQIRCKDEQWGTKDTTLCSTTQCRYRTVQQSTYRTKHVNDGCCCMAAHADPGEIARILRNGNIPLILSIDQTEESPQITLVESKPALAYVAVSHVWADGLGNLEENALPYCQLLRLSKLIRALPGESSDIVLFWMDTICVPPDGTGQNEAQDLAMQSMRQTYEKAAAVLVLDSWLLKVPGNGRSDAENLMRIYCSLWNSRLWTFQEGFLAKELYFQFANLVYNLDEGAHRIRSSNDLEPSLKYTLEARYSDLRGFRLGNMSTASRLLAITRSLMFRSTSVASDEALCLTTLLDLDMARILRCPPERRMEEFWKILPVIPSEVLQPTVERLDTEGLRWAPRSLMQHGFKEMTPYAVATDYHSRLLSNGLLFQRQGILFKTFDNPVGEELSLLGERNVWVNFSISTQECPDNIPYRHDPDGLQARTAFSINPGRIYRSDLMAFLFASGGVEGSYRDEISMCSSGFLVVIINEKDGIFYARRICEAMHHFLLPGINDSSLDVLNRIQRNPGFSANAWGVDRRNGTLAVTTGVTTSPKQQWCID